MRGSERLLRIALHRDASCLRSRRNGISSGRLSVRMLTVVDADGKTRVRLTTDEHGGVVSARGKDEKISGVCSVSLNMGGVVAAVGKDGKSGAVLRITEHGGHVSLSLARVRARR